MQYRCDELTDSTLIYFSISLHLVVVIIFCIIITTHTITKLYHYTLQNTSQHCSRHFTTTQSSMWSHDWPPPSSMVGSLQVSSVQTHLARARWLRLKEFIVSSVSPSAPHCTTTASQGNTDLTRVITLWWEKEIGEEEKLCLSQSTRYFKVQDNLKSK